MLLFLNGLAAMPFAPFRVKLLLLHAREALHLSNGSPLSLVQTKLGEMDYQKHKQLTNQLQFDYESSLTMNRCDRLARCSRLLACFIHSHAPKVSYALTYGPLPD